MLSGPCLRTTASVICFPLTYVSAAGRGSSVTTTAHRAHVVTSATEIKAKLTMLMHQHCYLEDLLAAFRKKEEKRMIV